MQTPTSPKLYTMGSTKYKPVDFMTEDKIREAINGITPKINKEIEDERQMWIYMKNVC